MQLFDRLFLLPGDVQIVLVSIFTVGTRLFAIPDLPVQPVDEPLQLLTSLVKQRNVLWVPDIRWRAGGIYNECASVFGAWCRRRWIPAVILVVFALL